MPRRILCLCPSGGVSGGPEALHQLCDAINRLGGNSAMLYSPNDDSPTPPQYGVYNSPSMPMSGVEADDFLIFPEPWHRQVIAEFDSAIWWLAVPLDHADVVAAPVNFHFSQSAFARHILENHAKNGVMLSDYIDILFSDLGMEREDAVFTNPAKGFRLGQMFSARSGINLGLLHGMSRYEMFQQLNRSKVYIEFGHNPGKDRIPREAAMCGNVVFMNRAGAGCFYEDYQLSEWFTFDQYSLDDLCNKVNLVLSNYDHYLEQQNGFRESISSEKSLFDSQVKHVMNLIG